MSESPFTPEQQQLIDTAVQEGARRACHELKTLVAKRGLQVEELRTTRNEPYPQYWSGYESALSDILERVTEAERSLTDE